MFSLIHCFSTFLPLWHNFQVTFTKTGLFVKIVLFIQQFFGDTSLISILIESNPQREVGLQPG